MPEPHLPLWVLYLQAFGVLLLAIFSGLIAWQQVRIAGVKLRHDLFERRFNVYEITGKFLAKTIKQAHVELDEIAAFRHDTNQALFLFDKEFDDYLKLIQSKAILLLQTNAAYEAAYTADQKSDAWPAVEELSTWLFAQFDILTERAHPFLKLEQPDPLATRWTAFLSLIQKVWRDVGTRLRK